MSTDSLETHPLSEAEQQLLKIGKDLAEDPATRKAYLALIKKKYPNQAIPELDTEAAIAAMAKPHIDKLAAMEKKMLERDVSDRIKASRDALRSDGFTDDDIKAIEKKMVDEQIPNHASAAKYFKLERTAAAPTPSTMLKPQLPVDKKSIKEAGGIKAWARTEAGKAIDDLKAGRVKVH